MSAVIIIYFSYSVLLTRHLALTSALTLGWALSELYWNKLNFQKVKRSLCHLFVNIIVEGTKRFSFQKVDR